MDLGRTGFLVIAIIALIGGAWLVVVARDIAGFVGGVVLGVIGLACMKRGLRS